MITPMWVPFKLDLMLPHSLLGHNRAKQTRFTRNQLPDGAHFIPAHFQLPTDQGSGLFHPQTKNHAEVMPKASPEIIS